MTRRRPIGFVIKPQLILAKHKATICYSHDTLLSPVAASVSEFFKSKGIRKKVSSFSKSSNLLFISVFLFIISFNVLPTRLFHIAGPLIEIQNLHLRNLICGSR